MRVTFCWWGAWRGVCRDDRVPGGSVYVYEAGGAGLPKWDSVKYGDSQRWIHPKYVTLRQNDEDIDTRFCRSSSAVASAAAAGAATAAAGAAAAAAAAAAGAAAARTSAYS